MATSYEIQKKMAIAYIEGGLSVSQVAAKFHVSPTTVSYYLEKQGVKRRSRSEAGIRWHITENRKKPVNIKEILDNEEEKLRMAGVMLYWAEGCKGGGSVKFANSDPDMIRLFLRFLREICGIWEDRIKLLIHMYPDHDEEDLIRFWVGVTGVPKKNFYRSSVHAGKTGTYKKKSPYGTVMVNYSDKVLLNRINSWIGEYR